MDVSILGIKEYLIQQMPTLLALKTVVNLDDDTI